MKPIKKEGVDTLILGCAHYPFLKKIISDIMGKEVILIDPAVSTASILKKILLKRKILNEEGKYSEKYYTTGSPEKVEKIAKILLGDKKIKFSKIELTELKKYNFFEKNS